MEIGDWLTRRHLLNGGVLIMGGPGSGKTSGSGATLGRAIVGDPLSSMLILAAKPEDAEDWRKIYSEKKKPLLEFSPEGKLRCNMIDFLQRCGADTREIVDFLLVSAEVLRGENKGGGETGTFFQDGERRFLQHAVEILRQAGVTVSVPNIQRFINDAALSIEQRNNKAWLEGFHNGCLRAAWAREKPVFERHDAEEANTAWSKEWVTMASKSRSGLLSTLLNTCFYFNAGIPRELMSTTTNCSPLDLLQGKSILVNCPSCEYGQSGALISTCWKYLTQKTILARQFKPGDFYNVIWGDEFWQVVTSFDQHYAATSRSHGGAMVALVQSRDSFYSALKGENGKHFADGLIGQFHHRIFHALGSSEDAEWASSLLGRRKETSYGGSIQPAGDCFDAAFGHLLGQSRVQSSFNESYQPILQPAVFMNGLRCGGRENQGLVDGIVYRSGEPFSNGENFICATFQQR
ncbi:MAG TPA: hypothetical protein VG826_27190 [Pirellulales bacterium]|nr:hypothetical protein [Pirellulales bacterium]